ncbi:MAG: 23S rRNA (pseudouridine(1915)-N(3))-methyltransferase RlmH [Alphaproteobacteria bacterium]|jgi:23S rRNA (pseudouridine1915-N3)-methyltransferase|nr:23S rRNA (pseudouridine(1915)-N(3))-methyltransferase RlmH [Alphaproteobacteria bacterium]
MRLIVAAVGRQRRSVWDEAWGLYAGRLDGPPLGPLVLKEVDLRKKLAPAELREREGEALLSGLPPRAPLVALDARGENLDSDGFAARLARYRDAGTADLAFVIGGAEGLSDAIRERADRLLAFGQMTWPHMLVRVMLAEQLYRARTILEGHPYHRG